MKIAITADVHLQGYNACPERFNALTNILDQILNEGIDTLIIAGDLFNAESQNYSEFDELCKQAQYNNIKFYIIPGNHDSTINPRYFTGSNIEIITEPRVLPFSNAGMNFFLLPYIPDRTMGEEIAKYRYQLSDRWALIAHGDYIAELRSPNPYEPGIYMPLTRSDIEVYNPAKVILGHIHKRMEIGKVCYVGSPCGLNISETERRFFLIINTDNLNLTYKPIDTDYIYFNEVLLALPVEDEVSYIKNKIEKMLKRWNLTKSEIPRVRIRLKVKGYTIDKSQLNKVIGETLSRLKFYKDEGPDLSEVSVFNEPERISILERVKKEIESLDLRDGDYYPAKDGILEQALHLILKE